MKRFFAPVLLLLPAAALFAQDTPSPADTSTPSAAAKAGIAAACGGFLLFWLVCIGIWIFLAIWIMRDAKRRNSPNATLVTVLGWIPFTTVIGLIVHLITRPKDTLPPPSAPV